MKASTRMQHAVQRYLDERHRLGFSMRVAGGQLMRFARFADARGHRGPLTLELQLDWVREHVRRTGPITWARRLELIRPFAAHYRQFEPRSVVPDAMTFGRGHRRLAPHIYSEQEIADLLEEAGRLSPSGGLRPATYLTMFGLIAACGLRRSEALNLRHGDVDLRAGTLTVRQTKFNKSRCLPLHPSTVQALREYQRVRDRIAGGGSEAAFFVRSDGRALPSRTVDGVFACLRKRLRWVARGDHPQPRIHDLRHTFAVRRVLLWQQCGAPIEQGMFLLCTYLGHAKISDTYWYLAGVPELMATVGERFERFALPQEMRS